MQRLRTGWRSYAARPRSLFALAAAVGLAACQTIASYDQHSYETATSLKAEALTLVESGSEPFSNHMDQVTAVELKMRQAYEYEKGKPANDETTKQWEILRDPEGGLLGGFLARWRNTAYSPAYVTEVAPKIAMGFDEIIRLEMGKPGR